MENEEVGTDSAEAVDETPAAPPVDYARENESLRKEQGKLRSQASKAQAETDSLKARLAELEAERAKAEEAKLSEFERAQKAAKDAEDRAALAEAVAQQERITARRATLVASDPKPLPVVFRERVTGDTDDEIAASIEEQHEAHIAMLAQFAMTLSKTGADELTELIGEEPAKAFLARYEPPAEERLPSPVSGPSAAGGQPKSPAAKQGLSGKASVADWATAANAR